MDNKVPPGWNDPPLMTYQAQNSKSRTPLNKRVAFPLSKPNFPATNNDASIPNSPVLPLPTNSNIPKPITTVNTDSNTINSEALGKVLNILNALATNISDESKKSDVAKRLEIMKKMWENNELNAQVQNQIVAMTELLEGGEVDKAHEIYLSLTVSNAAFCSSWAIGFKYIIHHCKCS